MTRKSNGNARGHRKAQRTTTKSRSSARRGISLEVTTREEQAIGRLRRWQGRHGAAKKTGTLPASAAAGGRESLRQRFASVFQKTGTANPFGR